jgi:hypothetical protein
LRSTHFFFFFKDVESTERLQRLHETSTQDFGATAEALKFLQENGQILAEKFTAQNLISLKC